MMFFMLQCFASSACSRTNSTHNNLCAHAPSVNAFVHCLLCQTHKVIRSRTFSQAVSFGLHQTRGQCHWHVEALFQATHPFHVAGPLHPTDLKPCDPFQLANVSRTMIALCASDRTSSAAASASASAIQELQTLLRKFVW